MRFIKYTTFSFVFILVGFAMADASYAADVYYSVGQTASDLKAGTPTVTIASGVATFSTAQTGNIGVGDRVTYNTTSIAYIASKTSTTVWNLVTATGAAPGDVTGQIVNSITREYTSLSAAEAGAADANHLNTTDLTSGGGYVLNFPCYYDTGADTTAVTINGWTTGASNYIKIYTPNNTTIEANVSQRHEGKWDAGKYNLNLTSSGAYFYGIRSYEDYVKVDGIQIMLVGESTNEAFAILFYNTSAGSEVSLSNNVVRGSLSSGASTTGIVVGDFDINAKIWNNIVYGWDLNATSRGLSIYSNVTYLYNNTVYGSNICYRRTTGGSVIAKNNIAQACEDGYNGTFDVSSDYNISNIASDAPSPSYRSGLNTVVAFVDEANDDFHLASIDTGARGLGADLRADANLPVTTDIDGHSRPTLTAFDIGADEATTPVFYSVGQNTTDHKTGSPTLTIASGVGTFSVAQTASNMGVGDKVTYNTNTIAYISQKISTTQWKLITATGGVPANITDSAVVSIAHAFASLSAAEAGAPGASYLNTSNLFTGNYQLNFPCYYDTGADTTAVTINGWTTGASNYIKVYTPNNTSTEVNVSQRHSGKWGDDKYKMTISNVASDAISIYSKHVWIDGLQVERSGTATAGAACFWNYPTGPGIQRISNNIARNLNSTEENLVGFGIQSLGGMVVFYVYNNIAYNFTGTGAQFSGGFTMGRSSSTAINYLYNNTSYNNYRGFYKMEAQTIIAKNNLSYNNTTDYAAAGTLMFDSSSTHNLSEDVTAPAYGTYYRNSTVAFMDTINGDFHLSPADTGARGFGADLSDDAYLSFQNDIDGEHRGGDPDGSPWDIGADEYVGATVQSSDQKSNSLTDGLILYQSFDGSDISGTTAYDRSSQGNNGTVSGAAVEVGRMGQALDFDGADDYVSVPASSSINNLSQFTWSFWAKPQGNPGNNLGYAVFKGSGSNWRKIFKFLQTTAGSDQFKVAGTIDAATTDASSKSSVAVYSLDVWDHWTMTYDDMGDRKVHIFKNGSEIAYSTNTAADGDLVSDSAYALRMGDTFYAMNGLLDEVRVYNRVLSTEEIDNLYRLGGQKIGMSLTDKMTSGLVGMWSFDGANMDWSQATAEARDTSGNGNHGDVSGAVAAVGKRGQALDFNGTTSYISAGSAVSLDDIETQGGGGMTISAWIKPESVGENGYLMIFDKGDLTTDPAGSWCFFGTGSVKRLSFGKDFDGTNMVVASADNVLNFNVWQHVALTWDGSSSANNVHIYVDGAEISSYIARQDGTGNKVSDSSLNLYIGNGQYNSRTFDGPIDEARVYNRVLSADEIVDLYQLGQVKIWR